MKCTDARTILSQLYDREPVTPVPSTDLEYLSANGYVLKTTMEDYKKGVGDVARMSQILAQMDTDRAAEQQAKAALQADESKEHSFQFHFEGRAGKDELSERIQKETAEISGKESEIDQLEANVNSLIQQKSTIDRMVACDGEYLSITGLGTLVFSDLSVRSYRVADQEFPDFIAEIKATYAELRSIGDKAAAYVNWIKPQVPEIEDLGDSENGDDDSDILAQSLLWSIGIGLAKLPGDTVQIGDRFIESLDAVQGDSMLPNRLMAAEIMTAASNQDVSSLEAILRNLDRQLRKQGVAKELSAGVAATIMAGRRFDGTYPIDQFVRFKSLTKSSEAASILAIMNVPYDELSSRFQEFRSLFSSWGFMTSEDTEIASAFLGIGELSAAEVEVKLKYVVEQLQNYLAYPIVAAAILASIPVFEAHEVLDLMEKAVTLLSGYSTGLERSQLVTLAVRMIHGVRNEIVSKIDPTAKITGTPIQFTYGSHPGLFFGYYPIIIAHSSYHATFSGMGGFHPAHSHGVGGFAG